MVFYNGGKVKNFEIPFLARKFSNTGLEYTKRCGITTFGGGMFSKKSWFCQPFCEKIKILDFWYYNGAPL